MIKILMLITDLGLIGYWVASATGVISVGTALHQWNWSFLGLDLTAALLGLLSWWLSSRSRVGEQLMTISLALTTAAGLMAINFYLLGERCDPAWIVPNVWLMVFPPVAIAVGIGRTRLRSDTVGQ